MCLGSALSVSTNCLLFRRFQWRQCEAFLTPSQFHKPLDNRLRQAAPAYHNQGTRSLVFSGMGGSEQRESKEQSKQKISHQAFSTEIRRLAGAIKTAGEACFCFDSKSPFSWLSKIVRWLADRAKCLFEQPVARMGRRSLDKFRVGSAALRRLGQAWFGPEFTVSSGELLSIRQNDSRRIPCPPLVDPLFPAVV